MSYSHELDEWRAAVAHATEAELEASVDSVRAALGIVGDREDARGDYR